ncbi:MAG: Rqc2 family fibronectin-binding protein [Bacillota bacterium]
MSLDGIAIRALTDEISLQLKGGRIDKIQQPDHNTILITIRQPGINHRLLLSVNPQTARFHLTNKSRENPPHPPLFCMVLRKHLEGSKIVEIKQQGLERIVHFACEGFDELGERTVRVLVGEFMGKHSNLILINPEKNLIVDSIKRFNHTTNQYREILPGIPYVEPPAQKKANIEELTEETFRSLLQELSLDLKISKALISLLEGTGPQTIKELIIRAGIDVDTRLEFLGEHELINLWREILWLKELLENKKFQPNLVLDKNRTIAFAPFYPQQFEGLEHESFTSMGALVEFAIGKSEEQNLFKQRQLELERIIEKELERCQRKFSLQQEKAAEGQEAEKYRLWGELLTANLHSLKQGSEAKVPNFYSEDLQEITIPLEPQLTPNENAQKFFKKYTKAKVGSQKAAEQSQATLEEINYLESILNGLEKAADLKDMQEIRLELEESGYAKTKLLKNRKKENKNIQKFNLWEVKYQGYTIFIGKNNKQNDYLTTKLAKNEDLWLHVKDIPGSHVIIMNPERKNIPANVLETAANMAAYFSKSRNSSQVPVDYTLKKHVKKPNGAKPGMVIYDNQKTIFITPDEEKVLNLIKLS